MFQWAHTMEDAIFIVWFHLLIRPEGAAIALCAIAAGSLVHVRRGNNPVSGGFGVVIILIPNDSHLIGLRIPPSDVESIGPTDLAVGGTVINSFDSSLGYR